MAAPYRWRTPGPKLEFRRLHRRAMVSSPYLFVPLIAGLLFGIATGWGIRHLQPILQFILAVLTSLFVYVSSLMGLSLLPPSALGCQGWRCIEVGRLFDILGLLAVAITLVTIATTLSILRLAAYKSRNDRRYWTDNA